MQQPISKGILLASMAAVLFGLVAPLVQLASSGANAMACSALLYLGAAMAATIGVLHRSRRWKDFPLRTVDVGPLLAIALLGGWIAPMFLVLGVQRIDAASASLLLALEAPFTFLLARWIDRERLGFRMLAAAVLIMAGSFVVTAGRPERLSFWGGVFVAGATLAWAMDNVLSRRLADRDPLAVVAGKGWIGGWAASIASVAMGATWPSSWRAVLLLATGAAGIATSLQLYLRAQRLVGAARTASVFSLAPFVGTLAALMFGSSGSGWSLVVGGVLVAVGVVLHATERHEHLHVHEELDHDHLHTHDDGHHDHVHDAMPSGAHAHLHHHARLVHKHPHGEDLHHRHAH